MSENKSEKSECKKFLKKIHEEQVLFHRFVTSIYVIWSKKNFVDSLLFLLFYLSIHYYFCCHGDIDFTSNWILTNLSSQLVSGENLIVTGQG